MPHMLATLASTVWFLAVMTPLAPISKGMLKTVKPSSSRSRASRP